MTGSVASRSNVVEVKYVPALVSEATDAEFEEETLPDAPADLRTNLAETAFFYPQLRTNEQGEISFSFTMPESLTRWNFRGYSHTKGMLTGTLDGEATTSKEFMLTPNLPRFVRVGDKTVYCRFYFQYDRQAAGRYSQYDSFRSDDGKSCQHAETEILGSCRKDNRSEFQIYRE